jgi:thiol-disulfide isomerase/thioredoxin
MPRPPRVRWLDWSAPARRRTSILLAVVAVAGLAAVAGVAIATWTGDDDPGSGSATLREYPAGERPPAPPIAGELLDGAPFDVADLRGDVVVVNIWGSWCPPCRAETGDLEAVYQATQELGVSFVGINIRDGRDRATRFLAGRVSYPSIFDPPFEIGLGFEDPPAPIGPPATLVIDRAGRVAVTIYRVVGPVELEQVVTRVAAEEAPADG